MIFFESGISRLALNGVSISLGLFYKSCCRKIQAQYSGENTHGYDTGHWAYIENITIRIFKEILIACKIYIFENI